MWGLFREIFEELSLRKNLILIYSLHTSLMNFLGPSKNLQADEHSHNLTFLNIEYLWFLFHLC